MGLRTLLAGRAVRVAHVLVIEAAGSRRTRMLTEAAVLRRGWQLATSPADADVLLSCGAPGSELQAVMDHVWEQMPGPRARVSAQSSLDVAPALESAMRALLDDRSQRSEARYRRTGSPSLDDHASMEMAHGDGSEDDGSMNHNDDNEDRNSDNGGGMEMDMSPDGIALADSAPDIDGLDLDVLHVPLGPVLPHWPAGLVLECTLQGDVIQEADARWLDSPAARSESDDNDADYPDRRWTAARYCDDAARLLSAAGWDAAAAAARQIRDCLLGDAPSHRCVRDLDTLAARVARNRILRWSLRGITVPGTAGTTVEVFTLPARWLSCAVAVLDGLPAPTPSLSIDELGTLGALVTGLDLASARMVVAGLALHPDARHGATDA